MNMQESAVIRKCPDTEIPLIGEFYDRIILWLDDHINYPRWIYGVYPSVNSVRAMAASGSQYVCADGEKILGAFALSAEPQGSFQKVQWKRQLKDGTYLILQALAIAPEAQRQGIGSEILRFCIGKAQAEGYKALRADIVPDNYPAKRLFEKNGFTYAEDADLELGFAHIPAFSMYEFNW